jgi:predicted Zn-dependent peptidase
VVAVGGPIKRDDVVARVKKSFAALPKGPRVQEVAPTVSEAPGPTLSYVHLDESQVEFRLLFPAFAESHPDHMALGLLRRVLDDGLSSRLPHRIVEKRGLAYSIGATLESFHDTGTFDLDGACAPEHLGPVVEECLRTLATLRAGQVTREELTRVQTRYAMHLNFLEDSPGDLCGWFGGTELFRPAETFANRAEAARAVSVKDLQRVASQVLTHRALRCIAVGPKSAKRSLQKVIDRSATLLHS